MRPAPLSWRGQSSLSNQKGTSRVRSRRPAPSAQNGLIGASLSLRDPLSQVPPSPLLCSLELGAGAGRAGGGVRFSPRVPGPAHREGRGSVLPWGGVSVRPPNKPVPEAEESARGGAASLLARGAASARCALPEEPVPNTELHPVSPTPV